MKPILLRRLRERGFWVPPPLPKTFRPSMAAHTVPALVRKFEDVEAPRAPEFDLREAYLAILEHYREHSSLADLPARRARQLPWVTMIAVKDGPALASGKPFAAAMIAEFGRKPRATRIVAVLRAFLQSYPEDWASFETLRAGLEGLLGSGPARLSGWRERAREFRLLQREGPRHLARILLDRETSALETLREAGLGEELEGGRFCELTYACALELVSHTIEMRTASIRDLQRLFEFSVDEHRLRFPQLRRALAQSLLEPFASREAAPWEQAAIQPFLIRYLGDPRLTLAGWQGVSKKAQDTIFGWLVGATLESFFEVIDRTADEGMWVYRHVFWLAYHKHRYIRGAWVALGTQAQAILRRSRLARSGRLSGAAPNQSVLIMQIGSLTLVEWSHSGKCRAWVGNNSKKPLLYRDDYVGFNLRQNSDFEVIHHSSESGRWQGILARYIADQTGIKMTPAEYMPRGSRK